MSKTSDPNEVYSPNTQIVPEDVRDSVFKELKSINKNNVQLPICRSVWTAKRKIQSGLQSISGFTYASIALGNIVSMEFNTLLPNQPT